MKGLIPRHSTKKRFVSVANPINLGHSNEKKGVSVVKGLIPRHSTKKRFVSVAKLEKKTFSLPK
ncbi:hypothetical protein HXA31_01270 [Salipaludibacillus agaradhaerens]|uniref:Uncharacterized protein n=1 Tax=Salipaludibacillus agaradhaerens TaxID=76935 RepID=A0A9Q4B3L4_SALAG|nr:hypothetical protein [Salipaludibacillus agaradhaerens]MCR6097520.1 hypothetical protein [Salipaludibacillus agaradhaerens]MCR6112996.1 hypothetical protein [Salipaludibacillus agaradhaerens]